MDQTCDKRPSRLISYIHHTSEYKQYCRVGNTKEQCRLGLFQDSDFARDLEDSKSTSGGTLCTHVQETNFSFAQINRIRNHFLGCRFKDGLYTRAWLVGSDRYCSSRKYESEQTSTGRLVYISNAKENSWKDWLILFPQTRILLVRKFCCTSLKTTKQWSRWS